MRLNSISLTILMFGSLLLAGGCGSSGGSGSSGGGDGNSGGSALGVPSGIVATAGNAQVSLVWGVVNGATSYNVKRSTTSGGPYAQMSEPTSASYVDNSVTNGTKYFYVVSAVDAAGQSGNSAEASATPTAPTQVPAVPTGLVAAAGNGQVSLLWTPSSGATSYKVKRSTSNGGPYTQISEPTSAAFTDSGLTNGTTYYYVVSAVNSAGESANSSQVNAAPAVPVQIPAEPVAVVATAGNAQAVLTWTASSGATSYHVKRGTTSGGPYAQVGAPASASYTDSGLTNGTTYYYVVSALDSVGESANSAQVSATPAAPVQIPVVPASVVATAGNAQVVLTWAAKQRGDQLSREAWSNEWRPVHTGWGAHLYFIHRQWSHERNDLLLCRDRSEFIWGKR